MRDLQIGLLLWVFMGLLSVPVAWAESGEEKRPGHFLLRQLYKEGHQIIEEHPGSIFNFVQLALTAKRWANVNEGSELGENIKDIAFYAPVTHGIEFMTIPLGLLYNIVTGASPEQFAMVTAVTLVVANAGTDPLCWIVFTPYIFSERYRRFMGRMRRTITSKVGPRFFDLQPRLEWVESLGLQDTLAEMGVHLQFAQDESGSHLSGMVVDHADALSMPDLARIKKALKPLNFNARHAVMEAVSAASNGDPQRLQDYFHLDAVDQDPITSQTTFRFKPKALKLVDRKRWKAAEACRRWLSDTKG